MRIFVLAFTLVFLPLTSSAHGHFQKFSEIKKLLTAPNPLHHLIDLADDEISYQDFVNSLNLFRNNWIDFNQKYECEGMALSPLAYYVYRIRSSFLERDVMEKIKMLLALKSHGAEFDLGDFDQVRQKLEATLSQHDVYSGEMRAFKNKLFEALGQRPLSLPPKLLRLDLTSAFGHFEMNAFSVKGIAFETMPDNSVRAAVYCDQKKEGYPFLEVYPLKPMSTALFVMMLGGKISPKEITETIAAVTDYDESLLAERSPLFYLARMAPGFDEVNSTECVELVSSEIYERLAIKLKLPRLSVSLLEHLGFLEGYKASLKERLESLRTQLVESGDDNKVLYMEGHPEIIIAWNMGNPDNELFMIRHPLAQILSLEVLLGVRNRKNLINIIDDFVPLKRRNNKLSPFARYLLKPWRSNPSFDAESYSVEARGAKNDEARKLHDRFCRKYEANLTQSYPKGAMQRPNNITVTTRSFATVAARPLIPPVGGRVWSFLSSSRPALFTPFLPLMGTGILRVLHMIRK